MLLQNGVISLDSTLKSHIYLIPTKKGYTLIDASFPDLGEKIIEEIKKLGIDIKKINNILLTHTDWDHIGSLKYLVENLKVPVYCSKEEYDHWMEKSLPYEFIEQKVKDELLTYKEYATILEGNKIDEFEIIYTPKRFHSFGMIMFLWKNMLFCGDMIQSKAGEIMLTPSEFNLDEEIYKQYLFSLDMKNIDWICQAHGKPLPSHPSWEKFINENV